MMMKDNNSPSHLRLKADILLEALPYMREYVDETFVIRYSSTALMNKDRTQLFAKDIVLLKHLGIHPVIIHGGDKQVDAMLTRLQLEPPQKEYEKGRGDHPHIDVEEMVLSGFVNKQLVQAINQAGGASIGLSGKDANLIEAKRLKAPKLNLLSDHYSNVEHLFDQGSLGEAVNINTDILVALEESDVIPVIAPLGIGEQGETYRLYTDNVAGSIAIALAANKIIFLTEKEDIYTKNMQDVMSLAQVRKYIREKKFSYSMHSHLETSLRSIEQGVIQAHIIDGTIEHALLLEIFTSVGMGIKIGEK